MSLKHSLADNMSTEHSFLPGDVLPEISGLTTMFKALIEDRQHREQEIAGEPERRDREFAEERERQDRQQEEDQ